MIFVDASYLIAVLSPRDQLYDRAQAWSAAINAPLLTTEYVLWELVNSLSYPLDRPKAHAATSQIRASASWEVIYATPQLFDEGLSFHRMRDDKYWSLTDCISFLLMSRRGIDRALTFDHHFEQAGFEALLRRDPA